MDVVIHVAVNQQPLPFQVRGEFSIGRNLDVETSSGGAIAAIELGIVTQQFLIRRFGWWRGCGFGRSNVHLAQSVVLLALVLVVNVVVVVTRARNSDFEEVVERRQKKRGCGHESAAGVAINADSLAVDPRVWAAILETYPDQKTYSGVGVRFFQQLAKKNLPLAWEKSNCKVLSMWGDSDFISTGWDQEHIARIVNRVIRVGASTRPFRMRIMVSSSRLRLQIAAPSGAAQAGRLIQR